MVKLQYRHVRKNLEAGAVLIPAYVESEITKGKYRDYDTFLGAEAVEYLKAYLEMRRKGTVYTSPEKIDDYSPLIRNEWVKDVRGISTEARHRRLSRLCATTDLRRRVGRGSIHYDLRMHISANASESSWVQSAPFPRAT